MGLELGLLTLDNCYIVKKREKISNNGNSIISCCKTKATQSIVD